jgi:hypothetical protein
MELDIISHQPPLLSGDIHFLLKGGKMKNLKHSEELPDELIAEVSTLYDLGLESYEVEYIISLRNKKSD